MYLKGILLIIVTTTMLIGITRCIHHQASECKRQGGFYFKGKCL